MKMLSSNQLLKTLPQSIWKRRGDAHPLSMHQVADGKIWVVYAWYPSIGGIRQADC